MAEKDILQRLMNLAAVKRHFENTVYADAAAEIERLRAIAAPLEAQKACRHPRTSLVHSPPPERVRITFCYECGGIWWGWSECLKPSRRTPMTKGDA